MKDDLCRRCYTDLPAVIDSKIITTAHYDLVPDRIALDILQRKIK